MSAIFRREKAFVIGSSNAELRQFSENCAQLIDQFVTQLATKCTAHLEKLKRGEIELLHGVDTEMIEIKLRLTPLMSEITKVL